MATSTDAQKTIVRNISGATKTFSFLPPHGKQLTDGEDYVFYGDLSAYLVKNKRKYTAYLAALDADDLLLVSSPSQYGFDADELEVRVVKLANDDVTSIAPATGTYSGSAPA